MFIVFRVACSPEIGTGHFIRCITLAEVFKSRGLEVCLVIQENSLARDISARFNGPTVFVEPDVLLPDLINLFKLNALIIDLPPSPQSLLNQTGILSQISHLNETGVSIVSLGHVGRNSQSFRAVIDLYPSQKIHAANYFEGPEFLILRPEFMEAPVHSEKKLNILVSMGGSDPHDLTRTALSALTAAGYEGNVKIILGAGYGLERKIVLKEMINKSRFSGTFHRNVSDMRALMRQASFAVVAFGITAYELMSQKIPVLAYTHYLWQTPSAKLFEELGCCIYLGCAEDPGEINSLSTRINNAVHSPDSLAEMTHKARNIVDGRGAVRVANLIENMINPEKKEQLLDVLFVLAHPGDELFGCGGTLLRHIHNKEKVGLVILGDGISSRQKESDDAASRMSAKSKLRLSLQAVVDKLGLNTWYYFRFEDNRFDKHDLLDIIKALEAVFKRHKPRVVYTNHPGDLNIDHRRTFEAVATALRPVSEQRLESLFCVEVPTSTDWGVSGNFFKPNWFVDIREHLDKKLKIINIYRDELRPDPHPRSIDAIRDRAIQWGRFCGIKAAEAFVLHRHVRRYTDE